MNSRSKCDCNHFLIQFDNTWCSDKHKLTKSEVTFIAFGVNVLGKPQTFVYKQLNEVHKACIPLNCQLSFLPFHTLVLPVLTVWQKCNLVYTVHFCMHTVIENVALLSFSVSDHSHEALVLDFCLRSAHSMLPTSSLYTCDAFPHRPCTDGNGQKTPHSFLIDQALCLCKYSPDLHIILQLGSHIHEPVLTAQSCNRQSRL